MNTDTDAARAYIKAIMNRLQSQYTEQALLPARQGERPEALSLQMLQRLYRYVMSEGYGE
jgi:hypothetical protein